MPKNKAEETTVTTNKMLTVQPEHWDALDKYANFKWVPSKQF